MPAFAIIETGGKQYLVSPNMKIKAEKLPVADGQEVVFDKVLLFSSDSGEVKIGTPYLPGAKVSGRIVRQARGRKIRIFKYKPKVRYRRRRGYRPHFSEIEITKI